MSLFRLRPVFTLACTAIASSLVATSSANVTEAIQPAAGGVTVIYRTPPASPGPLLPDYTNYGSLTHYEMRPLWTIFPLKPDPFKSLQNIAPLPPMRPRLAQTIKDVCKPSLVLSDKFAAIAIRTDQWGLESVVMDVAGDELRHPASLTKIMTLLLTFRALEQGRVHLNDTVPFSAHALAAFPVNLEEEFKAIGAKRLTLEQTMQAAGTKSANDAAIALAEHVGGSEEHFVEMMNDLAREIGMTKTVFKNASGLPDKNQVTTAYDLVLMMRYVDRVYPGYAKYLGLNQFSIPKSEKVVSRTFAAAMRAKGVRRRNLLATDRFIHINGHLGILGQSLNGYRIDWGKTGYVWASGFNGVARGTRSVDQSRIMAVVLGGKTPVARDSCFRDLAARL